MPLRGPPHRVHAALARKDHEWSLYSKRERCQLHVECKADSRKSIELCPGTMACWCFVLVGFGLTGLGVSVRRCM
jgi:hypothetical protein